MSEIKRIETARAPTPAGHYSQATVYDGLVHVAGQLPVLPDGTHEPGAGFEVQARRALSNLLAIVEAAGSSPDRILKVTVYLVGVENWPAFNAIYAEMLGTARPARSVVPVPELHFGYLVEIDAVAAAKA
jgi:2-iminobutanoate/2-iminopropanoate deaminase